MDGLLIVDKPAGRTSHDVVSEVRHLIRQSRVGHTGTLDPFATGVLVLLVGHATRLAQFLKDSEKEYEAVIRFGYATDSGDVTGNILEETRLKPNLSESAIESVLSSFRGWMDQVPPMFSAKKKGGRKLYELARQGLNVERAPVRVCIYEFESIKNDGNLLKDNLDGTTDLKVRVICSAGTYIRTLAEELGKRLGTSAHLAELRRTRAGEFGIDQASSLTELKLSVDEGNLGIILLPPDAALSKLPFVHLSDTDERRARQGQQVPAPETLRGGGPAIRMLDREGNLIGVGYFDAEKHVLLPRIVLPAPK